MSVSSPIIQFYLGYSPDNQGRKIEQIWEQNHRWLESTHDYIQWLFPLTEKSRFNPHAPILTDEDIQAFRQDANLRKHLATSFKLLLDFYGLSCQETEDGTIHIKRSQTFSERKQVWVHWGNHNHLRITRILKSLQLLGLEMYAQAFFKCLEQIYLTEKGEVTKLTLSHWQEAVQAGSISLL